MIKILLLFLLLPGIALADNFKFNPHTGKLDNTGPFKSGTLTDGKICTYESSTSELDCTTDSGGGSGTVGIGTTGRAVVQIGSTTTGTPYNNNFDANGNLGLGSVTPGTVLDVQGTSRQTGFILNNSPASGSILMSNAVGLGTWIAASAVGDGNGTPGGGLNAVQYNSPAGTFAGDATKLAFNGTNVGINSSAPGTYLDVGGPIGVGDGISSIPSLSFASDRNTGFYHPTDDQIGIVTGGSERNRFDANGNLIIHGTVPHASFEVVTDGASPGVGIFAVSSGATGKGDLFTVDGGGNVGINTTVPKAFLEIVRSGNGRDLVRVESAANGNGDWFKINDSGCIGIGTTIPQARLTIMGGNVGIGTWKPIAALDVKGDLYLENLLSDRVLFIDASTNYVNASGSFKYYDSTTSIDLGSPVGTDGIINAGSDSLGTVHLSSTPDSAGLFTSTYRGTFASKTSVLVNDNLGFFEAGGYNSSASAVTRAGSAYVVADGGYGSAGDATDSPGRWEFYTTPDGSSTQALRMVIKNDGNIGIGSTAPTQLLQVVGGNIGVGTYTVCTSQGLCPGSSVGSGTPGGSSPQLQYNNAGAFDGITAGGTDGTNIGIGTVSFVNRLNIVGNVGISTLANSAYTTQNIASPGAMVVEGNVGIGTWKAGNSLIVAVGNVGVGSLAPGAAVDINGALRLSNSGDSYFQGNVGIGTLIPMNTLSVQGAVAIGSAAYAGTAGADITGMIISGNIGVGTTKNTTAAVTVMNGRVGIGTWKPETALSVKGGALTALTAGADTVCTTTCGAFGCYAAFDTAAGWVGVDCTDASADQCFCSK